MRSLTPIVVSLYLASAALAACSSSSNGSSGPAPSPDAGPAASGSTPKPAPLPSASNDAGTAKPDSGGSVQKPTTCRGAAQCLAACGDDDKCTDNCYGGMSDAELKELQAISICIAESGCTDDACVEQACATEIATCLAE
jgi:hypothetical protein